MSPDETDASLDELRRAAEARPEDLSALTDYVGALSGHIIARWRWMTPAAEDVDAPAVLRAYADATRRLAAIEPAETGMFVGALGSLADLLIVRSEFDAAGDVLDEMLRFARRDVSADGGDADASDRLVDALEGLARIAHARKDVAAARGLRQEALAIRRTLAAADPDARDGLADALGACADLSGDAAWEETASACRDEQIALLRTLFAEEPDDEFHASDLSEALECRAASRSRGDRLADARADAEEAVAIHRSRIAAGHTVDAGSVDVALEQLAGIAESLEDWTGALRVHEERVEVLRRTLAGPGDVADAQLHLGGALTAIGDLKYERGDWPGAVVAYEQSVAHCHPLVGTGLDDEWIERDMSIALTELRDARSAAGDKAGALVASREAVVFARRLAARDPNDLEMLREVLVDLDELGELLAGSGDATGAASAYDEAESIARGLVATDPARTRWRDDLSIVQGRRARLALDRGDAPGAAALFSESAAELRVLVRQEPEPARWRDKLGGRLADLGGALRDAGDREGALAAYEEAVGLLAGTRGAEGGATDDQIRETLSEAADAASSAGRPDLAAVYRERAGEIGGGGPA